MPGNAVHCAVSLLGLPRAYPKHTRYSTPCSGRTAGSSDLARMAAWGARPRLDRGLSDPDRTAAEDRRQPRGGKPLAYRARLLVAIPDARSLGVPSPAAGSRPPPLPVCLNAGAFGAAAASPGAVRDPGWAWTEAWGAPRSAPGESQGSRSELRRRAARFSAEAKRGQVVWAARREE